MKRPAQPVALTIAGSDSGGGAGIQADLKTFAALEVHGTCAITCLTAQNPAAILDIQPARPEMVRRQMDAVWAEFTPAAVKTGMLFSRRILDAVVEFFKERKRPPLIVDPVMVSTSGTILLKPSSIQALQQSLLPLAALVTPNLPEAALLVGESLDSVEAMRAAARQIKDRFGCAALVKGGHLPDSREAIDIYYDGKNELLLQAPFIPGLSLHGTGCAYSAAITALCARGWDLTQAVPMAKEFVTQAIAQSATIEGHTVLNLFWNRRMPKEIRKARVAGRAKAQH